MASHNRKDESLCRRSVFRDLRADRYTHARLWLDCFLERQTNMGGPEEQVKAAKERLVRTMDETLQVPRGYAKTFWHRLDTLSKARPHHRVRWRIFTALGRLVVSMGDSGVLENALTFERTWGVPIIPGSALKGLCAASAHHLTEDEAWRKAQHRSEEPGSSAAVLFGTQEQAGRVHFLDAWWVPDNDPSRFPVHADVITAHDTSYYQDNKPGRPDGTDSPVPVSFLSASGSYLVMVEASGDDDVDAWLEAALNLLDLGLQYLGVGAKTNAGYGRMVREEEIETTVRARLTEWQRERVNPTLATLSPSERWREIVSRIDSPADFLKYCRALATMEFDDDA